MMERSGCPSPVVVERVYWAGREERPLAPRDATTLDHVMGCVRCRESLNEIEKLVAIGRKIEPAAWMRREEVRTTLLTSMTRDDAPRKRTWRPIWIAPFVVAAAAFAIWWSSPSQPAPAVALGTHRGVLLEHEGARAHVLTAQPDEIVRLVSGTITVTIPALGANERFRVITGADEIDAAAAAFDATAQHDRLIEVRVMHGEVKLLVSGETRVVRAGETWRATTQPADVVPPAPPPVVSVEAVPEHPRVKPAETANKPTPPTAVEPIPQAPVDAAIAPPLPPRSAAQDAFDAGWTALRANDYANAAAAFARARSLTVDPTMTEDASFWRGAALARGGEVVTAVHELTAFLREYPRSVRAGEVQIMVGWMFFERGDHADAQRHFEAAVRDPAARIRDAAREGLEEVAKRTK